MFLGAGASRAAGLPLTEELLQRIWPRPHEAKGEVWARRCKSSAWNQELKKAVRIIYPDGEAEGYRPLVGEFFILTEYERLETPIRSGRPTRSSSLVGAGESDQPDLLRYRSYDHPIAAQRRRVGFSEPFMATMAAGKDTFISALSDIWDDAYWVLSRAKRLDIIGYSFPPDDLNFVRCCGVYKAGDAVGA